MDISSKAFRQHPVRQLLHRAATGFAAGVDETELAAVDMPDELRDRTRSVARLLYDAGRSGGMRAANVAEQLAEDHAAEIVGAIPREYAAAVAADPTDTDPRSSAELGDAVIARRQHQPSGSEGIDERLARRAR